MTCYKIETFLLVTFVCLMVVSVCGSVPTHSSENFPLHGCSTDEMDLVFLYFDTRTASDSNYQWLLCNQFVEDLLSFSSNRSATRVMFAGVVDKFSSLNPQVNVSSWRFHSSPGAEPYGFTDHQARRQQYKNVQQTVDLKVKFVQRLFSEMDQVRQNTIHVALIFIDGTSLSYEESRSVHRILQQQEVDMKIFAIVIGGEYVARAVYLGAALIVNERFYSNSKHALAQAVCNRCTEGYFAFERNGSSRSVSCYKLIPANVSMNWNQAVNVCSEQGVYLAVIGSTTELNYLQTTLRQYFSHFVNVGLNTEQSVMFQANVFIGLRRDLQSPAKRFHWLMSNPARPLVVNNWMPGKPSEGFGSGCCVWTFIANNRSYDNISLTDVGRFVDGWVDVECEASVFNSFILCEMTFPFRIQGDDLITFKPSTVQSFNLALSKGNLTTMSGNIVSVSANVADTQFLQFIHETGREFPLFDCGLNEDHPRYISYVYVCDYIDHCNNRRDETVCMLEQQVARKTEGEQALICKGLYCCDGSCLPLQWVNDGEIDCYVCAYDSDRKAHDESADVINYLRNNETCSFVCNHDTCLHFSQLNDGRVDCIGHDGPLDETIGKLQTADTCYNNLGHRLWAPRCVYVRDSFGAILGCRDLSHLSGCTDFECQDGYIKCPNTYCIPQHYVLDGQVDCPFAEDEEIDSIGPCTGNFACFDKTTCLYPDLVCDGHPDCPHGDDEIDCEISCADGFRCVSGTVTVLDYNGTGPAKHLFQIDRRVRYIDLSGIDLSDLDYIWLSLLENMHVIIWSNCSIGQSVGRYFSFIKRVWELDLSHNVIPALDGSYIDYSPLLNIRNLNLSYNTELVVVKYLQLPLLEKLDLSHTGLSDIDEYFLAGLVNLKYLNLSFTSISGFPKKPFSSRLSLQTLDLRRVNIASFSEDFFNGLVVTQGLYTDSFELCCSKIRGVNIPYHTCHAPDNAISSCSDLVGDNVQRVLLWVVAATAVLGNLTVIGYRVIWGNASLRTGYGLFVLNLGISDLIMGIYLFIIAGADYYYRGVYILYDKSWRYGNVCKLTGFLSVLSCQTTTILIFLITLERYLVIKYPFSQIKFSTQGKVLALTFCWLVGFLIALTPILTDLGVYSANSVCLGIPLTPKRFSNWKVSIGVYTVSNLLLSCAIVCGQVIIFRAMSENRMSTTVLNSSSRRAQDIQVVKQLSLVALSNFLVWFPVGTISLLAIAGHDLDKDVYSWTLAIVLPINSALNPLLYTIPALLKKGN